MPNGQPEMESTRERYARMAREARAHAETVQGQLRKDFLIVAANWEAMAQDDLERRAMFPALKLPK
jgi:hypothetical protein